MGELNSRGWAGKEVSTENRDTYCVLISTSLQCLKPEKGKTTQVRMSVTQRDGRTVYYQTCDRKFMTLLEFLIQGRDKDKMLCANHFFFWYAVKYDSCTFLNWRNLFQRWGQVVVLQDGLPKSTLRWISRWISPGWVCVLRFIFTRPLKSISIHELKAKISSSTLFPQVMGSRWDKLGLRPFAAVLALRQKSPQAAKFGRNYETKNNCVHSQLGQIVDNKI